MVVCDGDAMRWKNVIFDFDGTLVDSQSIFSSCINELGETFGYGPIEFGSEEYREKSTRAMLADVLGLVPEQVPYWTEKFKALLSRNMGKAFAFKGMGKVLSVLAKRLLDRGGDIERGRVDDHILARDGIEKVDFIWADAPILAKDEAIEGLLADQALSPEETIYVGDEVRDIDACRKAGIKIISVSWGFNSKAVLRKKEPDYLVETPMQLLTILETPSPQPGETRGQPPTDR